MGRIVLMLVATAVLIGCCPLGTSQASRSTRPQVSAENPGLTLTEARQQCRHARGGVLALWRDQCHNPQLTEAELRDRAELTAARFSALLSDADLAAECTGIVAGKGGFADFARARGKQLEDSCLDDLGFRPMSRQQRSCQQIGF